MPSLIKDALAEAQVVLAFDMGLKATLAGAKLPLLTREEHSALVALRTTALCLGLDKVASGISDIFAADRAALREPFPGEKSPQEAG